MTGPLAQAPGSYSARRDVWGDWAALLARTPDDSVVIADGAVLSRHPPLAAALRRLQPRRVVEVRAGERAKTLGSLQRVLERCAFLPRRGTLVAIGGGTIGDLATVAAHVLKRGVRLVHAPTTLLAAVDSSVGGKGALNLHAAGATFKNALGVFHYAAECWLCPEVWTTLSSRQLREGGLEAWKTAAVLAPERFRQWRRRAPSVASLVRTARALKAEVCALDPYDQSGERAALNFGHTFGHVLESASRFRISHGDAVGWGMLLALDVGERAGVTPARVAREVAAGLREGPGLQKGAAVEVLGDTTDEELEALLAADKKAARSGELRMVLLRDLGRPVVRPVSRALWRSVVAAWRSSPLHFGGRA